ncbi:ABC transporter substrate-binding protein [Amycolatopsis endophytica]|uniref:Peptide/nickel transport system substrate-binding protein n=1 Tax=Amycolatopsis endophytica TaxID=860233 RepID=A0A853BCZ0_9PSEU|nr:ABC transporter substrate-binding protein [Amycolatopsis endophytica]NYI92645.1 peptide/nickel transport system substrate-binding protein [Amycolatopsis endophytica]
MAHNNSRWRVLASVAAVTVALSACVPVQHVASTAEHTDDYGTPVGAQAVQAGGELVMGLSSEPDRLDPTTSSSLYTRYVMSSICEKLYDLDAHGQVVPQLATALPTTSPDGRVVTIPVRTGITFADGTPFDAAAVRTSLQRHLTLKGSQRTSEMGPVDSVEAPDAEHVVLTFEQPFAPITAALADRAGMILSPTAVAEQGTNFGDHPVCVGPFKFVKRVPQTSIEVERDPLYYDAAQVHLDRILYRIMPDANIRAANLRSGDIEVADTISPQDVDALAKDPDLKVLQSPSLGYQGVTINTGNVDGAGTPAKPIDTPIARDPRVREAFASSVDRQTLVDTVFNNWFDVACSPIAPQTPYATPASDACPAYDPARSRRLLAEAGVPTPYTVTLQVSNSQDYLRYAQALQASVAEGGFDLKIVPVEYSTLLDVQKRGDFELLQLGWSGRIDPDGNTARFLSTGSGGNYGGFTSAELDGLLDRAARTTGTAERADLYGQATRVIQRENPIVYTYRLRNLTVHSARIAGVEVYSDGVVRLGRAAFRADQED